jgi:endonuclease YncB( thermonuclease family)
MKPQTEEELKMVIRNFIITAVIFFILVAIGSAAEFSATVTRVIDGDTVEFHSEILNVKFDERCRMHRYNAPETKGPEKLEGLKATEYLKSLVEGEAVMISTGKRDKYGHWLCEINMLDGSNINDLMREYLKDYPGRDEYEKKK